MKKSFFSVITLLSMTTLYAQYPEIVAGGALSMCASFDGYTAADLSTGNNIPYQVRGKTAFTAGVNGGKALLSGKNGATIIYECKNNLDFDKPGTLMVWFKAAENWHKNPPPFIIFWGLGGGPKGYLGLRISRYPVKDCPCRRNLELWIYHADPKRKPATLTLQPPTESKLCQGWHLVALAWSGDQVFMSYDGTPFRAYKLDQPITNADYKHFTHFSLGFQDSSFLLDDFRIYGKKLSDDELLKIWQQGIKKGGI